ncbi:transporter [Aequorivita todarodis]|uniref:OmpP1/FadL family transporter n=1 Tax=Aequorivita todarodis TaxID=2036821 RepID=UPI00235091D5|nr:transporter [Aequorivita todarodis]MDC8000851.1 transporter [Aequorivita todarodis]
MKKIAFLFMALFSLTFTIAQNTTDGLRYSTEQNIGTARFTALNGAMGALGGDFSAVSVNPAGGAVFLNSSLMLSASLFDVENKANYFNNSEKSFSDNITLNQLGGVFVINNSNEASAFKKFTIGLNFDTTKSFDNELYIAGTGNNSIGNFFLEQAQGIPLNLLQLQSGESISDLYKYLGESEGNIAQNAFLGYQGFIFDPVDPNNPSNTTYISNIANGSFNQEYAYLSQGYNSKFSINLATQITDNYFLGININTHTINFDQSSFLLESNSNPGSIVNRVGFENNLSVNGAGISAQIGAIAKIANNFRLGLSLDSPTWYQISEETSQYLESRRVFDGQTINEFVNPNIINVYEDYTIRTPAKVTASAAYIFGQSGLISFDYSYKDYSSIEFSRINNSYSASFNDLNNTINNTLQGTSIFKAGAEYRINQLSLRGGFHYEESPYQNTKIVGDLTGFSLGAGYNFGRYTFDVAYSRSEQERNQQLYSVGLTDIANITTIYSNFIMSLGFNF